MSQNIETAQFAVNLFSLCKIKSAVIHRISFFERIIDELIFSSRTKNEHILCYLIWNTLLYNIKYTKRYPTYN